MTRYGRFTVGGRPVHAEVEGQALHLLDRAPWEGGRRTGATADLDGAEFLPPSEPSKIVLVGQNYRKHAEEMGKKVPDEPLLFLKPPSSLNAHRRPIRLPPASALVHHEAELAVVIGAPVSRASEAEAARAIFGLTCFNDVTARDIQRREVQFTRAKGYDTFSCCGPWTVAGLSPADLRVVCRVNGEVRQDGRTSDMVFSPARLVAFISEIMTLLPGDVVSTGTPSGVNELRPGDTVEIEVEGIGTLMNPVENVA